MKKLAIVIPAFKQTFIKKCIESVINQTNQNFHLYICLDGANELISETLNKYTDRENVSIIVFENNIGKINLIKSWKRCIEQTKNEEYIWLFPDDDLMSENCVNEFYDYIKNKRVDLLRFNTLFINEKDKPITQLQIVPCIEKDLDYLKSRLSLQRYSSLAEHIFSRRIYINKNGFIEYPLAWFSDDATWLKFSQKAFINTIPNGIVKVRMSNENISSPSKKNSNKKIESLYLFLEYLKSNSYYDTIMNSNDLIVKFIFSHYNSLNKAFGLLDILKYSYFNCKYIRGGYLKNTYRLLLHNKRLKTIRKQLH